MGDTNDLEDLLQRGPGRFLNSKDKGEIQWGREQ